MRTAGTIIYYENNSGSGLIKEKKSGEFYFFNRNDIPYQYIIYHGLEISFLPFIHNYDTHAQKIRTAKHFKTGVIKNINYDSDSGYLTDKEENIYWFKLSEVIVKGNKKIQPGNHVQFCPGYGGNHPVKYAREVRCDNRPAIDRFCLNTNWDMVIATLAALAQQENWQYINLDSEPFPLLHNYFNHTFEIIFEQNSLGYSIRPTTGMAYAYMDTGLVSKNNEDIYGVFIKDIKDNKQPLAPYGWTFLRFTDNWMNLMLQCNPIPVPANYKCKSGFNEFDRTLDIKTNVEIILKNHKHLLPKSLLLNNDETCKALTCEIMDNTVSRLKAGTLTPVAKYFYGSIEYVAPLYYNGKQLNCALVIKRGTDNKYRAHTLIPIDVAYKNARLLGPVKSDWLKPIFAFSDWEM